MRNIFKSRAFVLLVFTFFCLLLIVTTSNDIGDFEWVGEAASAPLRPLLALFDGIAARIGVNVRSIRDTEQILAENEMLKARVAALERERRELESYSGKIREYQEALNLKGRFSEYSLIGGNVITRDVGNWFDVFKIDVGATSGVSADLPVVSSSMALIGRTILANTNTSNVVTLIDEECVVSGWITGQNGGAVVVRGDLTLKEQAYCRVDMIPDGMDIKPGDIVETSGIGGIFPRGIEIGVIASVRQTGNGLMRYALLEPFADLKKLDEVFILVGYGSEMDAGRSADLPAAAD
ncbi:MAG: rod shape-determining protein MreC [Clostridiales bacterium]|jgi:rod shape-determining protein MreC|nr:rod shape-determining protein MreC [Clostridiales bacterium]